MKNLLTTLKVFAALIIFLIVNDSVYSQNVISSVSTANNVKSITETLSDENSNETELNRDLENWMSNKYYLEFSNFNYAYHIMIALNEKVYEEDRNIEDWMLNKLYWQSHTLNEKVREETRVIEKWMFDALFWDLDKDYSHPMEEWMFDHEFWAITN